MGLKIKDLSEVRGLLKTKEIVTVGGEVVSRYEFDTFENVERFFINNFELFARKGYSTKVIGRAILVFKYSRNKA